MVLTFNTSSVSFAEAMIELLVKFSCVFHNMPCFSQLTFIQYGLILIPLAFPFKNNLLLDSVYQTNIKKKPLYHYTLLYFLQSFNLQTARPTLKWNNDLQNKDTDLIQKTRNSSELKCRSSLATHFNAEQINKAEDPAEIDWAMTFTHQQNYIES